MPNTGDAKLDIYLSLWDAAGLGVEYLLDWLKYEPVAVVASAGFLCFGVAMGRDWRQRAFCLVLVLYACYVMAIGGDFMRGRLFMPVFTGVCVFGGLALIHRQPALLGPPVRRTRERLAGSRWACLVAFPDLVTR